jgi:hypothetical protein
LKYFQTKRIYGRKRARVNKHLSAIAVMFFQGMDQLIGGRTVKVSHEL